MATEAGRHHGAAREANSYPARGVRTACAGGRLVYSTCSLEAEEGQQVVEEVLDGASDIRRMECSAVLSELRQAGELTVEDVAGLCEGPYLRTIPGVHSCDGFFAAIFEKISG